jgi:hypothetical protein
MKKTVLGGELNVAPTDIGPAANRPVKSFRQGCRQLEVGRGTVIEVNPALTIAAISRRRPKIVRVDLEMLIVSRLGVVGNIGWTGDSGLREESQKTAANPPHLLDKPLDDGGLALQQVLRVGHPGRRHHCLRGIAAAARRGASRQTPANPRQAKRERTLMQPIHLPTLGARYWSALCLATIFGANMGDLFARNLGLGHVAGLPFSRSHWRS